MVQKRSFSTKNFLGRNGSPREYFFEVFPEIRRNADRTSNLSEHTFNVFKAYWDVHEIIRKNENEKEKNFYMR